MALLAKQNTGFVSSVVKSGEFCIPLTLAARATENEGSGPRGHLRDLAGGRALVHRVMGRSMACGSLEPSESNLV